MVLSTAIPTLIAATVIVIISKGIPRSPSIPRTDPAVTRFGTNAITVILNDLNNNMSIKPIAPNTSPKDLIWEEKSDWSILL